MLLSIILSGNVRHTALTWHIFTFEKVLNYVWWKMVENTACVSYQRPKHELCDYTQHETMCREVNGYRFGLCRKRWKTKQIWIWNKTLYDKFAIADMLKKLWGCLHCAVRQTRQQVTGHYVWIRMQMRNVRTIVLP